MIFRLKFLIPSTHRRTGTIRRFVVCLGRAFNLFFKGKGNVASQCWQEGALQFIFYFIRTMAIFLLGSALSPFVSPQGGSEPPPLRLCPPCASPFGVDTQGFVGQSPVGLVVTHTHLRCLISKNTLASCRTVPAKISQCYWKQ